jgi:Fe-S cluster assembly scaffold protein SufB
MSHGLSEEEATSLIVCGFLDPEVPGMPEHIQQEVKRSIKLTSEKVM